MSSYKGLIMIVGAAAIGFTVGSLTIGVAQTVSKEVVGTLAANEGYLVDGKTFQIVHGSAKGDISGQIAKLNAKEIGPGIIVFRVGDKLYAALSPAAPSPQAMKDFQDQWAVGYMKAVKDFQDQWAVGYMKNFQDQWAVGYMKDFQDNWNVSYMKQTKDFQDNWNMSYMKNFQDQWNISYMNQVKNFQDNWATGYMK